MGMKTVKSTRGLDETTLQEKIGNVIFEMIPLGIIVGGLLGFFVGLFVTEYYKKNKSMEVSLKPTVLFIGDSRVYNLQDVSWEAKGIIGDRIENVQKRLESRSDSRISSFWNSLFSIQAAENRAQQSVHAGQPPACCRGAPRGRTPGRNRAGSRGFNAPAGSTLELSRATAWCIVVNP